MKSLLNNIFGVQSKLAYFLTLLTRAKFVGQDQDENRYYAGKPRKGYKTERRFVKFKSGIVEATQVPPEFHAWLHHQTDKFPDESSSAFRKPWQKPHTQNLTGTDLAYRPPGHILKGGERQYTTGDYEAWTPE
jgi:NADH:ubiquinone oxidoreductase subunit